MDNLGELVPNLDLIQELYRLEEFMVLHRFLSKLHGEALAELLSSSSEDNELRSVLIARINLLGTIINLPKIVVDLGHNLKQQEKFLHQFKTQMED